MPTTNLADTPPKPPIQPPTGPQPAPAAPVIVPQSDSQLTQPVERWAAEEKQEIEATGDKNTARLVDVWLSVCKSASICGWKDGQQVTRGQYQVGMRQAKEHIPARAGGC